MRASRSRLCIRRHRELLRLSLFLSLSRASSSLLMAAYPFEYIHVFERFSTEDSFYFSPDLLMRRESKEEIVIIFLTFFFSFLRVNSNYYY